MILCLCTHTHQISWPSAESLHFQECVHGHTTESALHPAFPPPSVPIHLLMCETPSQVGDRRKGTIVVAALAKSLQGAQKGSSVLEPLIPSEKTSLNMAFLCLEPFSRSPQLLG